MVTVKGIDELSALVGEELGASSWLEITQERVDQFADSTGDHQWIHVDPARAAQGPFGGPIAHGYLTLSLVIPLFGEILKVDGVKMGVNYGLEKVRFPSPVRVGSKIRLVARLVSIEELPEGAAQGVFDFTIEVDGSAKPACVARPIYRYFT
ncbi:MaoC family dehydratase [Actinoplanes sp. TBRC 11911]|uniref:MaoC family dehydratase n=1 Tax=Actinoplanes sp. TBRC 11911 TaxID=2729386 RepID=UPI00145DE078|nr:MaoC family dehydratase [Actinoplanes sp. TBRC 11911]NMO56110.1 MaoC family dehydratase [Actinoplanes sp. TBRC 11911]